MIAAEGDAAVVRVVQRGEKVKDLINEIKGLTWETGNEHAVVKLSTGERAIVSGGPHGIEFAPKQVKVIYGHTHPTKTLPSDGDVDALRRLNQSQQTVFLVAKSQRFAVHIESDAHIGPEPTLPLGCVAESLP